MKYARAYRILEKYCPSASVMGNTAVRADIELQEEAFRGITEEDRVSLRSLGWKSNERTYGIYRGRLPYYIFSHREEKNPL